MSKTKLTLKKAIELSIKKWEYLAENDISHLPDDIAMKLGIYDFEGWCGLCQYQNDRGEEADRDDLPGGKSCGDCLFLEGQEYDSDSNMAGCDRPFHIWKVRKMACTKFGADSPKAIKLTKKILERLKEIQQEYEKEAKEFLNLL